MRLDMSEKNCDLTEYITAWLYRSNDMGGDDHICVKYTNNYAVNQFIARKFYFMMPTT